MAKEKKFITCDGNAAAAHIAYMFSEVSTRSLHLHRWLRTLTNGRLKEERICSEKPFVSLRCSLKAVLPVLFMVHCKPVP